MNVSNTMILQLRWFLLATVLALGTNMAFSYLIEINGDRGLISDNGLGISVFSTDMIPDEQLSHINTADNPLTVQINLDEEEGKAHVFIRGEHFTTYNFHENTRIPHLWPVHADGGITLTRNWPMGEDDPEITDHRHHKSMWTAYGDVNGYDHWHSEPIITKDVQVQSGDDYGLIRARNVWADDKGEPVVDEIREYRFYNYPASGRLFDHTITFKASYGEVTFGDDKEGMFAFRIRTEIQGNRAGVLTNAKGAQGERAVYGTPVPWMDYSGPVAGLGERGIALFSHPGNMRLPAWHVRDYGLVGCNFFAMQDVAGLDEEGTYVLSEDNEITFHVRFYIHNGDVEQAGVRERYEEFARTPFPSR